MVNKFKIWVKKLAKGLKEWQKFIKWIIKKNCGKPKRKKKKLQNSEKMTERKQKHGQENGEKVTKKMANNRQKRAKNSTKKTLKND